MSDVKTCYYITITTSLIKMMLYNSTKLIFEISDVKKNCDNYYIIC